MTNATSSPAQIAAELGTFTRSALRARIQQNRLPAARAVRELQLRGLFDEYQSVTSLGLEVAALLGAVPRVQ